MLAANNTSPILVIDPSSSHLSLLDNWHEFQHHHSFRAIKKQFSRDDPALIVACIGSEEDEKLCQQVSQFVRNGLANQDTRIAIMRDPAFDLDEVTWMEEFQINCCLVAEENKRAINLSSLNRELDTFNHIHNHRRQHDAETEMLMCITQFSKEKESLNDLLKHFSATLSTLSYSACCIHLKIRDTNQADLNYCDQSDEEVMHELKNLLALPNVPDYLQHTLTEKHPQINLLPDNIDLHILESKLTCTIGSYLAFPISAYDKVLYLLLYLIPEEHMDKVSMKQINVINKACEQLTMLLERRQAETSLKKQYLRLKDALVELKSTREELQNKEKMASIGQMAAGIAHEINNPLSYVISNFSSMDNYLSSIIELQGLQSEFLQSIESEQIQQGTDLRKSIMEFEEEQDIAFVLEDIRAVVTDSHNGLQRVKNIINDLKSFTHSQSAELEICHINEVIEDTLKILKYDIGNDITIEQHIETLPPFMAHNGLMQQVFTNLVKNAVQAMRSAQTVSPTIALSACHQGKTIEIRVKDNGPGIPKDKLQKIFEPFFTTKDVGEGTGLGLSVTFNIIKKLGGEIKVNSEPEQFTEFTMTFPAKLDS